MNWTQRLMHRPAIDEPGHAHELTFTCYHRHPFLRAEQTCEWLAEAINKARQELDFLLWAYVFMPEHAHVLVYPRQPIYKVSRILSVIKEPMARKAIRQIRDYAPRLERRSSVPENWCPPKSFRNCRNLMLHECPR
jgi:putative transposase